MPYIPLRPVGGTQRDEPAAPQPGYVPLRSSGSAAGGYQPLRPVGTQQPATVEQAPEIPEPSYGYPKLNPDGTIGNVGVTTTLPGGGQYRSIVGDRGRLVQTPRDVTAAQREATRGGSFSQSQSEVDHIIPVALGGTGADVNLQSLRDTKTISQAVRDFLSGKKSLPKDYAPANRQEGKMLVEWRNIDDYNAGRITLDQARQNVLDYSNSLKNQTTLADSVNQKLQTLIPKGAEKVSTIPSAIRAGTAAFKAIGRYAGEVAGGTAGIAVGAINQSAKDIGNLLQGKGLDSFRTRVENIAPSEKTGSTIGGNLGEGMGAYAKYGPLAPVKFLGDVAVGDVGLYREARDRAAKAGDTSWQGVLYQVDEIGKEQAKSLGIPEKAASHTGVGVALIAAQNALAVTGAGEAAKGAVNTTLANAESGIVKSVAPALIYQPLTGQPLIPALVPAGMETVKQILNQERSSYDQQTQRDILAQNGGKIPREVVDARINDVANSFNASSRSPSPGAAAEIASQLRAATDGKTYTDFGKLYEDLARPLVPRAVATGSVSTSIAPAAETATPKAAPPPPEVAATLGKVFKREIDTTKPLDEQLRSSPIMQPSTAGDAVTKATVQGYQGRVTAILDRYRDTGLQNITPEDSAQLQGLTTKIRLLKGNDLFDPEAYVRENVAKQDAARKAGEPTFLQSIGNFAREVKSKLVDFAAPIEDVFREVQRNPETKLPMGQDITNQIDRVLRAPSIAGQFARDNGLDAVIQKVDNLENLNEYLKAKQAIFRESQGIETGRDIAKDQKLVDAFSSRYERDAQVVNGYSRKLLDYMVDSGLVSRDFAEKLKADNPGYVPLNRIFSEAELDAAGGKTSSPGVASLSSQSVIQKIVGSEREIEDPITSLVQKTTDAFKQGEKNKAARMLASYKDIPGNPFGITDAEGSKSTISYLENGSKRTVGVPPDIAAAAKSLNVQQLNILGKILAAPVRLARLGITGINLPFIAANVARDQVTGAINSSYALKTSIANPSVFLKSLLEAVRHGDVYEEMNRNGALGTSFDISRNAAQLSVERIRAERSLPSKVAYTATHPGELLRAVEDIVARGEELTRIQQYVGTKRALLDQGMSVADAEIGAAKAARENTVNFARRGEWGQVLNSALLYINAGIQGTRTLLRNLRDNPLQTASKIAVVGFTPVAATTAWNLSDPKRREAYQDIAEYEKENNIIIIPPDPTKNADGTWNVIKIPISQEISNMLGMVRRPVEAMAGLSPVAIGDVADALIGTVEPVSPRAGAVLSSITPQAIKPIIEGATNYNLFYGTPQVPGSLQKLSPEMQVQPYTSGSARVVGRAFGLSPITVEDFIKGTFGGLGSQVLNVSDRVLAGLHVIPPDQIGGQDVLKAIVARFSQARGGHLDDAENAKIQAILQNQADESFRRKQEAEILYGDLSKLPVDEANQRVAEIAQSNKAMYDALKAVADSQQRGLDYNDRLMMNLGVNNGERAKFIWENLKAFGTPEEKNAYLDQLRAKKVVTSDIEAQLAQLQAAGY